MTFPSAVLLHGVQSSRSTWWRVGADLRDLGWEVRTPDLLGHGTNHSDVALDIDVLAADVIQQAPAPVDVLMGHSLGAVVALTVLALEPGYATSVVLEDPPALGASLDGAAVAANVQRSVSEARTDPSGTRAALLETNPRWSPIDARNAVENRIALDVDRVPDLLRNRRWDLPALVARCPVPVHLLAATHDSALREPQRAEVMDLVPAHRRAEIDSGHSIHRDRPGLWLAHVLQWAQPEPAPATMR